MICFVLAAGYATRLYPLTENYPKPLLEVRGKRILDWLTDDINGSGAVDGYVVISNHKYAAHFDEWAASKPYRVTVVDDGTLTNETRLGAVKDIRVAMELVKPPDDLLVIAGDNLLDFSLSGFISYAREKRTSCVMRYREEDVVKLRKCGVVCVDDRDRITDMEEKPQNPASHWVAPPFYYLTGADANRISLAVADGCGVDAPGSYIAWLCRRSPVHAMIMPGKRYDIGTVESYHAAREAYRGISRR